jgi:quercetin dioxygenase-like cupin family protein
MLRNLLAFLTLAAVSAWPQQGPVEVAAEPGHHLVLDNLFVRAFSVTVNPKSTTLMHRHGHNYLAVVLGDSEIENIREGAQPVTAKLKDGDVVYSPAGVVHAVRDSSSRPFRNITIELKQPTTNQKACTGACAIPVNCEKHAPCASVVKVMTADQWSVTRVTIPAGGFYPRHTHLANFLVIPLTDGDLKVQVQDLPETTGHDEAGKVAWHNPVIHTITNTGSKPAQAIILEFRGRPAGEGSESMAAPEDKAGESKPHDHH